MTISLNRSQTAAAMGVEVTTLDRWVRDGCPAVSRGSRGREWVFHLPDVVRWFGDRKAAEARGDIAPDILQIEIRSARAKMELAELELAKARAEVAPVREFEHAQSRAMAAIQARVMAVPQRVVMSLLGETNETKFKQRLADELRAALETAADSDLKLDEEADGDDAS